jgi:hypothetical protein
MATLTVADAEIIDLTALVRALESTTEAFAASLRE